MSASGGGGQKKRKRTSTCVIDGIGGRGYKTCMDLVDLEARSTFLADLEFAELEHLAEKI